MLQHDLSLAFAITLFVGGATATAVAADDVNVPANPEKDVFFGTTHGHSSWSIDAFGLGNQKIGPEDGYRFARGESVAHIGGKKIQLKMPLDFFMMTDHSEMMGTAPMLMEKGSALYDTPIAKMFQEGDGTAAFTAIGNAIISGVAPPGFNDPEVAQGVTGLGPGVVG